MGKYLDSTGLQHFMSLIKTALSGKQATLVSGTNIKTINNQSLLGSGNISVGGGGSAVTGVKGNSESTYRTGNVNLTAANVGAAATSHTHAIGDVNGIGELAGMDTITEDGTSRTKNTVLAAPNGSNGAASFRSLVLADLPTAVQNKLNSITSTNTEVVIESLNGLARLVLTYNSSNDAHNLRVDTRASTSASWASAYYPGIWPVNETTIANVITQTSAQSSANPITAAKYYSVNGMAMLEISFKPAAARAAGTAFDLGTVVSGKRPHLFASGGSQTNMARMTIAGAIQIVPRGALSAGTTYTIGFTYLT